MTLLVVGTDRVDAGKTTFSTGLIETTGAVGFKPRAGNDYWFHHDDYLDAIAEGSLYGKDARRLAEASPGSLDPTAINPVHRLWTPAPGTGAGLLGQDDREFLVDRAGEQYVINGTTTIPEAVETQLPLSEGIVVDSLPEFNRVMGEYHLTALETLAGTIQTTERAVVESYSNVARPVRGLEPDAVAAVEPMRVRLFDGSRFRKACEVASGSEGSFDGQLEERVGSVIELIEPEKTVSLPALSSDERGDPSAVADAYAQAYESLLGVAGWGRATV